ncbi:prolyl-tRNA synthetase associated domain-containing protein [Thalassospiraceae bacterium LMO-JJ14]|nr:prolyl-tRNA synthetase associated domain-containing protein [Thalassospiraceae bacterium LMO-JJ14]
MHTRETLLEILAALDIASRTFDHPPVHTVEEAKAVRGKMVGAHSKNLFLKDKKGRMYLLSALEDRQIDLKSLCARLSTKSLSFASAERLMTYLGVEPGSVTPFGVINDSENQVTMALDAGLMEFDTVNFHPLVNTATTALHPRDLIRFLESCGHAPLILEL